MYAFFSFMQFGVTLDNAGQEFESLDAILAHVAKFHAQYVLIESTGAMLRYVGKAEMEIVILVSQLV